MKNDTILVTGAAGFIGTYLIDALIRDGYKVIATDVATDGNDFYSKRGIDYIDIDTTVSQQFVKLNNIKIDAVVHLAACQPANVSEKKYDPRDYINVNVIGTLNVLEFCRKNSVKKIIYVSSHRNTQGLWQLDRAILEEDGSSIKYQGEYAMFSISESAAQDCISHYHAQYGLKAIVFRLPPVYGYGPHTEIFKEGRPIKTGFQVFIDQAKLGEPLEVWGNCERGRDIIYVKDVVAAFMQALSKPDVTGLFNITSGVYLTLRQQAEIIASVFWNSNSEPQFIFKPNIENGIESFLYDNSKAKRELGWYPKYTFKDMLIDYQKEAKSKEFEYLIVKRKDMLNKTGDTNG